MANLSALREQAIAMRRRIMEEVNAEYAARNAEAAERLRAAAAAAEEAAAELRRAEQARRAEEAEARQRERNVRRNAEPRKTRKRHPGANYEIAGRPAHLAPGAPLRSVEGKRTHSQTLAQTRGRRTKAKY